MKQIFGIDGPLVTVASKLFDCMCASVLWAVFSLPVVTMGAASAALYKTSYHNIRKSRGGLFTTFIDSFKENFVRSTLLWLIELAILALLITDTVVFRNMELSGEPLGGIYWVMLVIDCITAGWLMYAAAYSSHFDGSIKDVIKFSIVLMLLHPIKALEVIVPLLGGAVLALAFPPSAIVLPAGVMLACSFPLEKVFLQHLREEDRVKLM